MSTKELSIEKECTVELDKIEQSFYDSMSNSHDKKNLSWIGCLFSELNEDLGIERGIFGDSGYSPCIARHLHKSEIYAPIGNPKVLFYTEKLPKGFNLFMTGPHHNNDHNLEIICSTPHIHVRDFEEEQVIRNINSDVEELIKGKHNNVGGIIKAIGESFNDISRVILYKTWEMPVNPCFSFHEDIKDIQNFSRIYNNFFNYQKGRDRSFKDTSKKIVQLVIGKKI